MEEIIKWSNPGIAQENAYSYLGPDAHLYLSNRKGRKIKILDINTNKYVNFLVVLVMKIIQNTMTGHVEINIWHVLQKLKVIGKMMFIFQIIYQ